MHIDDHREVLGLCNNTPKSAKQSPIRQRQLKRLAEPATPLQKPRFSRKRQSRFELSWAQVLAILDPDAPSESETYREQIKELEEVIEFTNLEYAFNAAPPS